MSKKSATQVVVMVNNLFTVPMTDREIFHTQACDDAQGFDDLCETCYGEWVEYISAQDAMFDNYETLYEGMMLK